MTRTIECVDDIDCGLRIPAGDGRSGPTTSGMGTPLTIIDRLDMIKSRRI